MAGPAPGCCPAALAAAAAAAAANPWVAAAIAAAGEAFGGRGGASPDEGGSLVALVRLSLFSPPFREEGLAVLGVLALFVVDPTGWPKAASSSDRKEASLASNVAAMTKGMCAMC